MQKEVTLLVGTFDKNWPSVKVDSSTSLPLPYSYVLEHLGSPGFHEAYDRLKGAPVGTSASFVCPWAPDELATRIRNAVKDYDMVNIRMCQDRLPKALEANDVVIAALMLRLVCDRERRAQVLAAAVKVVSPEAARRLAGIPAPRRRTLRRAIWDAATARP